ncbi:FAD:protein FMN transferase [Aurantimicrobium minutum]|uniref:FAD:protein FMN transferase n=1 Tax=Aurantimicrobium minutum TaxID=708131 RepID=UPI002474F0E8|nr:FAD:protein FMN transferase [Aurantimicrobium minutum]
MVANNISHDALRAVFTETHSAPGVLSRRHKIMGGHGTITLVGGSEQLLTDCWALAEMCEELWSRFLPDSDISRINWSEGAPVQIAPLTRQLIAAMIAGHALSEGTYDPTLLPLVIKAGYTSSATDASRVTTLPASAQAPGHLEAISFSDTEVVVPRGTTLDPGGMGKGVAADVIAQHAMDHGAFGVMVELGGDIVLHGHAPDGVAWRLGVEDPFDSGTHLDVVRIQRGAIVTSSQLKRRFGSPEAPTHHLINPATEISADSPVQTVTVIASSGARAEALTKAGFQRSPRLYLDWLPTVGAAGFIVMADGSHLTSTNWSTFA